jgi:uncharacterized membrane protein YeiB
MMQVMVHHRQASHYGLRLKLRPNDNDLPAPLLNALEATLSTAWLRYFRFGPLEWLWRCVTYARVQPLRPEPVAAAVVA